jgi:hypothetical protein
MTTNHNIPIYTLDDLNKFDHEFKNSILSESLLYFLNHVPETLLASDGYDNIWSLNHQNKRLWIRCEERPYNLSIFDCKSEETPFDLICVDGRDRVSCLETIVNDDNLSRTILILDNTERVSSKYQKYTELLKEYNLMHFEAPFVFGSPVTQPESNNGLKLDPEMPLNGLAAGVYRDRSGNCNKGRSITTVAIPKCCQPFTSQGHPFYLEY